MSYGEACYWSHCNEWPPTVQALGSLPGAVSRYIGLECLDVLPAHPEGECVIMASFLERGEGSRWPRMQRFQLSAIGTEAEAAYQAAVKSSHNRGGREAFDQAVATWAAPLGVQPGDGVFLSELRISVQTLTELVECLVSCGTTKSEATAALDRLLSAKLAELVAR